MMNFVNKKFERNIPNFTFFYFTPYCLFDEVHHVQVLHHANLKTGDLSKPVDTRLLQLKIWQEAKTTAVTVNGDCYRNMLSDWLFLVVDKNDDFLFQKDGAQSSETIVLLNEKFPKKINSLAYRGGLSDQAYLHLVTFFMGICEIKSVLEKTTSNTPNEG